MLMLWPWQNLIASCQETKQSRLYWIWKYYLYWTICFTTKTADLGLGALTATSAGLPCCCCDISQTNVWWDWLSRNNKLFLIGNFLDCRRKCSICGSNSSRAICFWVWATNCRRYAHHFSCQLFSTEAQRMYKSLAKVLCKSSIGIVPSEWALSVVICIAKIQISQPSLSKSNISHTFQCSFRNCTTMLGSRCNNSSMIAFSKVCSLCEILHRCVIPDRSEILLLKFLIYVIIYLNMFEGHQRPIYKRITLSLPQFAAAQLIEAGQKTEVYKPTMTSYDYDCPVSESGRTGQPGIGGPNKFEVSLWP